MPNNRTVAKIAEIFFASGIPIVAAARCGESYRDFLIGMPFLLAVIFAGGWHIKTVNDEFESKGGNIKISKGIIIPLAAILMLIFMKPSIALPIVLIIISWNFYSLFGKNYFILSMMCNFLGGFLHFVLGMMAAGSSFVHAINSPESSFFGFAMLCGSMHHDSYHAEADRSKGFETGAVRFGPELWWQLAISPMLISMFFLTNCEDLFMKIFLALGVFPYFIGYFGVLIFADHPSKKTFFRPFCRTSFGLAAVGYIFTKIFLNTSWH
ncbi:MAG TPA: hypothetical protein PK821_00340 [Victivallales bacterium]|nr:hypothetical protein [Victivallales bacterium]